MPKRSLSFLVIISLFGIGLGFIVSSLDPFVYTAKLRLIAPPHLKNTGLSFITTMALFVALFTQPIIGRWSDRVKGPWGKRAPFLVGGVIGLTLALSLIIIADTLWLLVLAAMLSSASSNTVQGVWQAFIPDYVPSEQRGTASATKSFLEVIGVVCGVSLAGFSLAHGLIWLPPITAIGLFILILFLTLIALNRSSQFSNHPSNTTKDQAPTQTSPLFNLSHLTNMLKFVRQDNRFFLWVINRILFWSAGIMIQTFLINYLEDSLSLTFADIDFIDSRFILLAIILVIGLVFGIGTLADRVPRQTLLIFAGVLAASGTIVLIVASNLLLVLIACGIIAVSVIIFVTASWALATDLVHNKAEALTLGIANGATVIGSISGRIGGPIIDSVNQLGQSNQLGYTVTFGLAAFCFICSSLVMLAVPRT